MSNSVPIGLDADHCTMVKFTGFEDTNFHRVLFHLRQLVEGTQLAEQTVTSLRAPKYDALDATSESTSLVIDSDLARKYRLRYQLPFSRNEQFIGRENELSRLMSALHPTPDPSERAIVVLHGLLGIGKSQIVQEYLYRYYRNYSAILWIDGDSETTIQEAFHGIAQNICTDSSLRSDDYDERCPHLNNTLVAREFVKDWLSEDSNDKWIMVFENANSLESNNLQDYIPWSPHSKVIVVSRNSESRRFGNAAIYVGEMDRESARKLLCSSAAVTCNTETEIKGNTQRDAASTSS